MEEVDSFTDLDFTADVTPAEVTPRAGLRSAFPGTSPSMFLTPSSAMPGSMGGLQGIVVLL